MNRSHRLTMPKRSVSIPTAAHACAMQCGKPMSRLHAHDAFVAICSEDPSLLRPSISEMIV